ncbi:hypothetical protein [Microbacterium sp. VKM Ac-2923]|uniref:hypothetical protein n=1 Tax=Microbacterium sp. VKM Ac-2923 TaxID=2929476 RepID=UPI001FB25ABF|nr:hypothetical protein [Microbacterium sp. VKM Ac-2923]MCJ1706551.1 hypothetical protein [Microbacterium sp. VKM Ac-2923]
MRRGDPFRTHVVTVTVVAILSIGLGLFIGGLTGQYVTVFFVQLLVAALLAAWYVSIKKRVAAQK